MAVIKIAMHISNTIRVTLLSCIGIGVRCSTTLQVRVCVCVFHILLNYLFLGSPLLLLLIGLLSRTSLGILLLHILYMGSNHLIIYSVKTLYIDINFKFVLLSQSSSVLFLPKIPLSYFLSHF